MTGSRTSARAFRRRLSAEDGVTLTELLVVLAILAIVLGGMTTLFLSATTSQIDQTNRVQAQQEARLALDALRREIHCASKILPDTIPSGAALINVKLGRYCPTSGGTLTTAATTIPAAGTYPVSVASTSAFGVFSVASPETIYVGTSGTSTCTGKTATSFTGCSGGAAGIYPSGSDVTGNSTWCTKDKNGNSPPSASSSPYSLWRYPGSRCSGTGRKWADYLTETTALPAVTAGKVFVGYTSLVVGELRALTIALPVDVTPNDGKQRYLLRDDIVLRNSPRS